MDYIFYILLLPVAFDQLMRTANRVEYEKYLTLVEDIKDSTQDDPANFKGEDFKVLSSEEKKEIVWKKYKARFLFTLYSGFMCFVGFFTFQWPLFVIITLTDLIFKSKWGYVFWNINTLINATLLFFAVINKFHLHINVWEMIKNLI